jgi:hypothetical protein
VQVKQPRLWCEVLFSLSYRAIGESAACIVKVRRAVKAERGAVRLPWWGEIIVSQVVEGFWRAAAAVIITGSREKLVVFVRVTWFGLGDGSMIQLCAVS